MDKKILKLENNKEYFMIEELKEDNINYLLLMNVDNEFDLKIVKKFSIGEEYYIVDIEDEQLLTNLKGKFKQIVENEKLQFE